MNEELYIGFESYLTNQMPAEERIAFEEKLKNNAELHQNFQYYRATTQFLDNKFSSETINFKANLKNISEAHFENVTTNKSRVIVFKPWYYAAAASVALFLGTWVYMQNASTTIDPFAIENASFVERGDNDINIQNAQKYYNEKEYLKAVMAFDKIKLIGNPELQYYFAISLIETKNYTRAEDVLNNLRRGNSIYIDKANIRMAQIKLIQKHKEDSKKYLNQIPKDSPEYEKAQYLLKDL